MISPEKRTRPLLPGGLEQATRAGRRRRAVAVGLGSAVTTVAVAGAAVLALGHGSPSTARLVTDPTSSPTSGATPTQAPPVPTTTATRPGPSATPALTPSAWGAPGRFVSYRLGGLGVSRDGLYVSSARTGAEEQRLDRAEESGLLVNGTALDRQGRLWVSSSKGPSCTSGIAGCGPKPGTCRSQIDRYDASVQRTVVRTSPDLMGSVEVSPDGRYVAFSESPCVPSYFNDHVRVLDTSTGSTWTLGAALPRCHDLWLQGWFHDSRHLLVAYGAATSRTAPPGDGTCTESGPLRLVEVDATRPADGISGRTAPVPEACTPTAGAPAADGGVEELLSCGATARPLVRLTRLDAQWREVRHTDLGRCSNGTTVTADRSGTRFLVAAYLYCAAGGDSPKTTLWTDTGSVQRVTTVPGGSEPFRALSW